MDEIRDKVKRTKHGKYDFIIKILEKELFALIGKSVVEAQERGVLQLKPKTQDIKAIRTAIQLLREFNKSF